MTDDDIKGREVDQRIDREANSVCMRCMMPVEYGKRITVTGRLVL